MILKFYRIIILIIAILFFFSIIVISWVFVPVDMEGKSEKVINIPYGYNSTQIRFLLEKEGIIRPFNVVFQTMTKFMNIEGKLQSGEYRFNSSQNLAQIIDQLVKGKVITYRITIPEGYQAKQIARLLEEKEIIESEDFLKIVNEKNDYNEGYLFPDTYEFPKNFGSINVLHLMKKNFEKNVLQHINPNQEFPENLNFHQIIILASIIEKEAQGIEDKPKIASVFYNRLRDNMRLQSCATIQYLLEKPQKNITQKDLEIESPFNTYLYKGLPPEPICNPGLDSILAAAYPLDEEFYYFVLGKDGKHIFTKTYQEHLENKP